MVNAGSLTDELPRHQYASHLLPGVSVVIVTHNRSHLLQRALQSVCAAESVCEVVVIDNASTDATPKVCASVDGFKYVRIDRAQTLGGARNIGLMASRGEFVTFLDDDDVRLQDSIARQVEVLKQRPDAGFVYGQATIEDAEAKGEARSYPKQCRDGDIFWPLVEQNFIASGSVIYRRSALTAAGLFGDQFAAAQDWDMCVRLAELGPIAVCEHPVIIWRRSTPGSRQLTSDAAMLVSAAVGWFREWMKLPRARESRREFRRVAWQQFSDNLAEHLIFETVRALSQGLFRQSLRNALTLFKLEPFSVPRIVIKRWPQIKKVLIPNQRHSALFPASTTEGASLKQPDANSSL